MSNRDYAIGQINSKVIGFWPMVKQFTVWNIFIHILVVISVTDILENLYRIFLKT